MYASVSGMESVYFEDLLQELYTHKALLQGAVGAIGNNKMSYCKCDEIVTLNQKQTSLSLSLSLA